MISLLLCAMAFVSVHLVTRRSLRYGILTMFAWGYFYGILRANLVQVGSHFTFDAAVAGLYVGLFAKGLTPQLRARMRPLVTWTLILCAWPIFMFLVPIQDPFVQLVGLRANILLLPFMLIGLMLDKEDRADIGHGLAILNLIVFGFAVWEYVYGIQSFYPRNEVTEIIYRSRDLIGNRYYRIPGTFTSAHAFGGMMVTTVPWILEAFASGRFGTRARTVHVAAISVSIVGVFMCAARTPALLLVGILAIALFYSKLDRRYVAALVVIGCVVGWVVMKNERMQRFTSLQDTDYVTERLAGSVNENFVTLLFDYPMGNGMGAGGTSMPYFLEGRIVNPVVLENDYARILLEQGLPGLALWCVFIAWLFLGTLPLVFRGGGFRSDPLDRVAKKMIWFSVAATFLVGATGLGMFASVPGSALFLVSVGWICEPGLEEPRLSPRQTFAVPGRRITATQELDGSSLTSERS